MDSKTRIILASAGAAAGAAIGIALGVRNKRKKKLTTQQKTLRELERILQKSRIAVNEMKLNAGKNYAKARKNAKSKNLF